MNINRKLADMGMRAEVKYLSGNLDFISYRHIQWLLTLEMYSGKREM